MTAVGISVGTFGFVDVHERVVDHSAKEGMGRRCLHASDVAPVLSRRKVAKCNEGLNLVEVP